MFLTHVYSSAVPQTRFGSYQVNTWLPYMFKRYVLRQNVVLQPLYNLDEVAGSKTYADVVGH